MSGRASPTSAERLLLDTHVFIWWRERSPQLGTAAAAAIASAAVVHVSVATVWEIAIKVASGKLRVPSGVGAAILDSGFVPLDIAIAHAEAVATLPPHQGDPFDRLLAAQARHEGLRLVTHDRRMADYGIPVLWA